MSQIENDFTNLIQLNKGILFKISKSYADTLEGQEDLRQEMIYNLWKGYPSFQNKSLFSTWMYRVCLNTALMYFRQHQKSNFYELAKHDLIEENSPNQNERLEQLYAAIRSLSALDRSIILLYLDEIPYKDMSRHLGLQEGNLRVKINRIKSQLKNKLNQ